DGKPDAAHVRNALARIPQSNVSESAKAETLAKVQAAAKELGIDTSKSLSEVFESLSDEAATAESFVSRSHVTATAAREFTKAAGQFLDMLEATRDGWEKRANHRTKSGRVISAASAQALGDLRDHVSASMDRLQQVQSGLSDLMDMACPDQAEPDADDS